MAFVVLLGRPNYEDNVYDATLRLQILLGAMFLAYLIFLAFVRELPGPTALDWCVAGLVVAYAMATLWSVNPRVSAESALPICACVISFYVFHERRLFATQLLVRAIVVVTSLAGLLTLLQMATQYASWAATVEAMRGFTLADLSPPPVLRSRGVLDHPNNLAMFLNIALPFAIILAFKPGAKWDRGLALLALTSGILALFFTLSRGAWLGTLVSQPLFWLLVYLHTGRRLSVRGLLDWTRDHLRALCTGAAVCALGIGTGVLYVAAVQPPWLFRQTLGTRFETLSAAFEMFLDHPLSGAGPNTFGLIKHAYGIEQPYTLNIAHNAYVQVLVDVGLFGGVILLAAGAVLGSCLVRGWRSGRADDRLVVAACTAAIVATLVHGLSDSPPTWNTVLLPFALVLAIAMRYAPLHSIEGLRRFAVVPRLVVFLLIAGTLAGWLVTNRSHSQYDLSLRAWNQGQLVASASHAAEAAGHDPDFAVYQLHAGISLVALYLNEDEAANWPGALDDGIGFLRQAVELDPHGSLGFANLAVALQLQGDRVGAGEAARHALAVSLADPTIAVVAGSVFEAAGMRDDAIAAYARAVSIDPGVTQSPYWASTPQRQTMRAAVIEASGLDACTIGHFAALYGVFVDDLDPLAAACGAIVGAPGGEANRSSLALILFALGRVEEARIEGERALLASTSPETLVMSAIVLAEGDLTRVRTYLFQASQYGGPDAAALLAYTYAQRDDPATHSLNLPALPQQFDEMPAIVSDRLHRVAPAGASSPLEVGQLNRMAKIYFSDIALREVPATVFIPGEWSELVSPAVILALQIQNSR